MVEDPCGIKTQDIDLLPQGQHLFPRVAILLRGLNTRTNGMGR